MKRHLLFQALISLRRPTALLRPQGLYPCGRYRAHCQAENLDIFTIDNIINPWSFPSIERLPGTDNMDFRTCIERCVDIVESPEKVSPELELSRIIAHHGKTPLLFHNVNGTRVCANLYADRAFVAQCLSTTPDDLLPLISKAIREPISPRIVNNAPFLKNEISPGDLGKIPIPFFYPGDGGPYLTASVFSVGAVGTGNISYHRVMVTGSTTGTVRLVERDLHRRYRAAVEAGKELQVAIAIGVPPEVAIAGAISVAPDVEEYKIANSISSITGNGDIELYEMENGCAVPAGSEYVLLGRLTAELGDEGPFVDITGTRDHVRQQPVLKVERIYHRDEPVFHAILPGGYEHFLLMGMPREARIYDVVQNEGIDVRNVLLTPGGCSWLHGAVSIEKRNEDDGMTAGKLALAAHTSMKHVFVVDDDIDIFTYRELEWAMATRFQADRDMKIITNQRGSSLDPSSSDGTTAKAIFDATMPLSGRGKFQKVEL
ncbi:MAG: UbiD family decarboxylase [Candidatus Thermoplasmatota archaeon]|nr:UbiD family decarboxylase [Candidatus Thermoplasmatota archaeon]MDP7265912.1 UbiD family decarboxylase [Candidatus Thermoplasmatota archaeon]